MVRTRHRLIAWPSIAAAALALLAACGGGSDKAASTTVAGVTSTVKATKGGDFCKQIAATYNEALSFAGTTTARSPEELRQAVEKTLKDGQTVIDDAPDAVKPALRVIQNAVKQFSDALAKVDYDVPRLGSDALAAVSGFTTPEFQQAAANSQAFVKDRCGLDLGPTTTVP